MRPHRATTLAHNIRVRPTTSCVFHAAMRHRGIVQAHPHAARHALSPHRPKALVAPATRTFVRHTESTHRTTRERTGRFPAPLPPPPAAVGTADRNGPVRTHVSSKPVVLIAEELSPATVDALGPEFEIRHCNGADRAELLPAIADVDAILIRSATKVDAEAIAAANKLKVVARAGVGLDNIDVSAATKAGVIVVERPTSNIVTRARRAGLRSPRRHRPPHPAGQRRAEERRVEAQQVHGRGARREDPRCRRPRPHRRARRPAHVPDCGSRSSTSTPTCSPPAPPRWASRCCRSTSCSRSPTSSPSTSPRPETVGLIGDEALRKVKPSVRIVNAARGGIVDEEALYSALKEGRVAGAGLDVYAKEPCTNCRS
ncbi:Erythronate-4-phosphate dehydrogenase [Streptomyces hirsutus]